MKADVTPPYPFEGLRRRHYAALLVDPPWQFKSYTALPKNWRDGVTYWRSPEVHYNVMDLKAIMALPIREIAAPDSHLFLCATGPCLNQAFMVMEKWGFRYSGVAFVWIKVRRGMRVPLSEIGGRVALSLDDFFHVGLGLTTRKNVEFVLLGRRGAARRVGRDVREVIVSPVREHSRKPDEIARRIERYCAGPYLELFARAPRPSWSVWGNEIYKFA
jgi:N6-adenosine-specific RNA methylase IME4